MSKALAPAAVILASLVLYLLLWPVPVDPVSWNAPVSLGLVDPFGTNNQLRRTRSIDLGNYSGPEDAAIGPDGMLYVTSDEGVVLRIQQNGNVSIFAETGGRPLGIEFAADGSLIVANAYLGVQRIAHDGSIEILFNAVNGRVLVYADDIAIARDGTIYVSEASTKFGAQQYGGTYEASLLDILEHGGHGQIIEYRPDTGETRVLVDNLNMANGVAVSNDQDYLLIAETGSYRILKYWLRGPRIGNIEVLIDNLPGFPDNINNGMHGRFWIGLVAPRIDLLDKLSDNPRMRKIVQRLPARFRPRAEPSSHVIAINGDGEVLMNLQDPNARFPSLTGVLETRDVLYLTSLFGNQLPKLSKQNL